MRRKVGSIPQMATAAHHRQINAGAPALHFDRQDIHVLVRHRLNRLLVQHPRQRSDLVAQFSRLLKFQPLGVRHHAGLQLLQQLLRIAAQQRFGVRNVLGISLAPNQAHARRGATLDLVQQTRARAVGKHRVFAGAQAKHLLQQQDGFFDGPRAGVGAKVAVLFVDAAAVVRQAGKVLVGDFQIRIALVVAKQDVVFGLQRLDKVVL